MIEGRDAKGGNPGLNVSYRSQKVVRSRVKHVKFTELPNYVTNIIDVICKIFVIKMMMQTEIKTKSTTLRVEQKMIEESY